MKITVGISNRHVHLTEETYKYLFDGKEIEKRNDLNQKGEFASTDTVDIEWNNNIIEHVRIVGPYRSHNQVELLKSDTEVLKINAPIRRSGDLSDTPSVYIVAKEKVLTDGVIVSENHVHVPTNMVEQLKLKERDTIYVNAKNGKFLANVKVSDNGYFELHIDKEEATKYGLTSDEEVEWDYVENR